MGGGPGAPRGALEPCDGERSPPSACRSRLNGAEGSLIRGTSVRVEAALTTTGRASTVRWRGSGKRDGKVYARNQRRKAPQAQTTSSNLTDKGWVATHTRWAGQSGNSWVGLGRRSGGHGEGLRRSRGEVAGAYLGTDPVEGSRVNVGTTPLVPANTVGKSCRRSMLAEWGGGPVVVRARESRVHGEGVECAHSFNASRGGRW